MGLSPIVFRVTSAFPQLFVFDRHDREPLSIIRLGDRRKRNPYLHLNFIKLLEFVMLFRHLKSHFFILVLTLFFTNSNLATAQSNCNANTPVANDVCLRMQNEANRQCYQIQLNTAFRSVKTVTFHSCESFDRNGLCVSARYICQGTSSPSDPRHIMSGVRG